MLAPSLTSGEVLPVSAVRLIKQDSYVLQRVYAGQLEATRTSHPGFEFSGVIAGIAVREGDLVSTGDELVMLATGSIEAELSGAIANLETAEANILSRQAQLELSAATLKRFEDLVAKGHDSKQRLDELRIQHRIDETNLKVFEAQRNSAEAAVNVVRANLAKHKIVAPYDAVIQARHMDEGSVVAPGQAVLTLVESGHLEARIGIPEDKLRALRKDSVYPFIANGRTVYGELAGILPVADASTGSVTTLFRIDDAGLVAGTLIELKLDVEVREPGFWVPLGALSESQRGLWSVLVVSESSETRVVESRLVEILHHGNNRVFVRGTLDDGELIVSAGTSRIVAGQEVQLARIDSVVGAR